MENKLVARGSRNGSARGINKPAGIRIPRFCHTRTSGVKDTSKACPWPNRCGQHQRGVASPPRKRTAADISIDRFGPLHNVSHASERSTSLQLGFHIGKQQRAARGSDTPWTP